MKRVYFLIVFVIAIMVAAQNSYAVPIIYTATLDGASESPPVVSSGTGVAMVIYDGDTHTMSVDISFSGLTGTTTVSHIHAPTALPGIGTAGVATPTPTFPGFPAGVTAGNYHTILDLTLASSYNAPFLTNSGGTTALAEAALASYMAAGRTYVNIHTSFAGGGEIRGFLTTSVPEPTTMLLLGFGLIGLAGVRRS